MSPRRRADRTSSVSLPPDAPPPNASRRARARVRRRLSSRRAGARAARLVCSAPSLEGESLPRADASRSSASRARASASLAWTPCGARPRALSSFASPRPVAGASRRRAPCRASRRVRAQSWKREGAPRPPRGALSSVSARAEATVFRSRLASRRPTRACAPSRSARAAAATADARARAASPRAARSRAPPTSAARARRRRGVHRRARIRRRVALPRSPSLEPPPTPRRPARPARRAPRARRRRPPRPRPPRLARARARGGAPPRAPTRGPASAERASSTALFAHRTVALFAYRVPRPRRHDPSMSASSSSNWEDARCSASASQSVA